MVGVEGREGGPLHIYSYEGGGYCEVRRGEVSTRGEAGRRIEVALCEGFMMTLPLASARSDVVREYQAGLWALKSPIMMLLS